MQIAKHLNVNFQISEMRFTYFELKVNVQYVVIWFIFYIHIRDEGRLKDISTQDFLTPNFNPGPFNPRLFNTTMNNLAS